MPHLMMVPVKSGPPLQSAGMDKNGDQNPGNGTWTKLTGWVVRAGYSGTTISNDSIIVDGTGTVTMHGQLGWNSSNPAKGIRVYVNNTLALENIISSGTSTVSVSGAVALNDGDEVHVEAWASGGSNANRTVREGSTYLYWDAA